MQYILLKLVITWSDFVYIHTKQIVNVLCVHFESLLFNADCLGSDRTLVT